MMTRTRSRQLMLVLTIFLSIFIIVVPPSIVYVSEFKSEQALLQAETEINAQLITNLINHDPELWAVKYVRIRELLNHHVGDHQHERRTVRDLQGKLVVETAEPLTPPFYVSSQAALMDSGQVVGTLTITRSQHDLLMDSLLMGTVSALVGLGFLWYMFKGPLSALGLAEKELFSLATYDPLTGLYNRATAQRMIDKLLEVAKHRNESLAIFFLDLNGFKRINDTLGHDVGDQLLTRVANRLRSCVRESDVVARQGGDEFLIAMSAISSPDMAARVAEKIVQSLDQSYQINGSLIHAGPSIGIAIYPGNGSNRTELMIRSDLAMYQAKARGRSGYQIYSEESDKENLNRENLAHDLHKAMEGNQFVLHYQPQINLHTGLVCGVEALIRWQHPEKGLVSPYHFISTAEENGAILPLGEWVLKTACHQLTQWKRDGLTGISVSVNVSPLQFESDNFSDRVADVLKASALDPGLLELEITESVMFKKPNEVIERLHALRNTGVALAIDDFGTGYSSLNYLKELPVNRLKLDLSFIRNVARDEKNKAICASTIRLAGDLGLDVVAEGVETKVQLDCLKRLRCDSVQGYYFCKPLPAHEAFRYIQNHNALPLASGSKLRAHRVLIVDDDPILGDLLKAMIENAGHHATMFTNPQDGLDMIMADGSSFDLVLADLLMPEMSGLDFLKQVRQYAGSIPVAVVTAYDVMALDKLVDPIAEKFDFQRDKNFFAIQKPVHVHDIMELLGQLQSIDIEVSDKARAGADA